MWVSNLLCVLVCRAYLQQALGSGGGQGAGAELRRTKAGNG